MEECKQVVMKVPKFSIVMIAKNEAKTLPRCIESLKEFIARGGEIILCDTGSTDGTAELARQLGCTVTEAGERFIRVLNQYTASKCNDKFITGGETNIVKAGDKLFDFAAARNYATSLAKNDMICTLDADEAYSVLNIDALNSLIDEGYQQFEYQFVFAHDYYGRPTVQFVQSKFFDRRVIRWDGIVHEVLQGEGKRLLLGSDVIFLEHWQQQQAAHRGNYLAGLAIDCYENPDKDRQSHYFARELMWRGHPKSAIKEFERHVAMDRWPTECAQSMIFMGDCYGMINKPEKQVEWYNKAFFHDPNRREALIKLAYFYKHNNRPLAVLSYAKAALEIPWTDYYANDRAMYEQVPHELLYWAYGWTGNIPEAQNHILKAMKYCPCHPDYARDTKYYFSYPDNGVDGFMYFEELLWLNTMAKDHLSIAELGSWKGRSTHALASGCRGTVTAIDTWLGSADVNDLTNQMAKQEDVFETFKNNTQQFSNIKIMRRMGSEAAKGYPDKSFDAVFIDAGHTYEEIKEDIDTWLPKAKMLICGHDYDPVVWKGVVRAVDEKFGKPDGLAFSIWYKYLVPRVTFLIPTLGRPEGLQRCLDSINNLNYPKELIEIIVLEGDDTVPKKMARGLYQAKNEYIVFASNDTEFTPDSLYNALQVDNGLVAFNTGELLPDEGNICEHFLIRKSFVKRLGGEIFDTEFNHVGCDNLLWAKAKRLGENSRAVDAIVNHYHFTRGQLFDSVYEKGWSKVKEDRAILAEKLIEFNTLVKPNFSICMIVKNEEKALPRALDSIKNFRDSGGDVVVLDTGSIDSTVSIAEKYGCSVYVDSKSHLYQLDEKLAIDINKFYLSEGEPPIVQAWDKYFHFSEARNHAASLAKNDIILVLDADEIMVNLDIAHINEMITKGYDKFECYQVYTHRLNGEEEVKFLQDRIYDRRVHSWSNIVHENLYHVRFKSKCRLEEPVLKIDHYQNKETNRNTYLVGMAVDCFFNHDKTETLHYLARELFWSNRLKAAKNVLLMHLEADLPPQEYANTPTHMESMLYLGNTVGLLGDLQEELKLYIQAMELNPDRREPVLRIAEYYKWYSKPKEAMLYAKKALGFPWNETYGLAEKFFKDAPNVIIDALLKEYPEEFNQIPKRIFTIWLNDSSVMPDLISKCIVSQKLEGFEHRLITLDNCYRNEYIDACIKTKQWAKAADYLRIWYLYNEGGIYLDADMEILKPFDDALLSYEVFACKEENGFIANSIIGSVPKHPVLSAYLEKASLYDEQTGLDDKVFEYGMELWTQFVYGRNDVKVFPAEYFIPYNHQTGKTNITDNTYTYHHFLKSWKKEAA